MIVYEYPEGRCWRRNDVPISGTDINTPYTLTDVDAGAVISGPIVLARNDGGDMLGYSRGFYAAFGDWKPRPWASRHHTRSRRIKRRT